MRERAEQTVHSAEAELLWITRALASKKPKRVRRTAQRGNTKKRVLDFIAASAEPVGPSQVRDGLNATGTTVGDSAIYNTFKRLHDAGEIERVENGLYRLPARNGDRADEIEDTERLSIATGPHEGHS